jgi:integrase
MLATQRTWREAAEHFRGTYSAIHHQPETGRIYGRVLEQFGRAFGEDRPLAELSLDALEAWQLQRKLDGVTESTVNKDFSHLKAFISWCVQRGWIAANPAKGIRKLRVVRRRKRVLEPHEIRKLLDQLELDGHSDVADWLRIGANTGARYGEIMALRVCDVDLEHKILTLANHGLHRRTREAAFRLKDREDRIIPMNDILVAVLSRRRLAAGTDPEGRLFGDTRKHRSMFDALVASAERAGLGHVTFQTIRRSFATIMAGIVTDLVLTELMGWSTLEVGRQYYIDAQRMKIQPPPNIG